MTVSGCIVSPHRSHRIGWFLPLLHPACREHTATRGTYQELLGLSKSRGTDPIQPPRLHSAALCSGSGPIRSSRRTWANFTGLARRLSAIIRRSASIPACVKNNRGMGDDVSSRIRPRSTTLLAGGGSFGRPRCGPPRQIFRANPSATEGKVLKNWSSSRERIRAR